MDKPAADFKHAQLLINAKRYDEALRIVAAFPEDARARLLAATAYSQKNDLEQSLREIDKAIALEPDGSDMHAFRSAILHDSHMKGESLEAAREAVRLDPQSALAQFVLGRSALAVSDRKLAQRAADEALRLAPEWSMAHDLAGFVAAARRRRNEAEAHFRNALAIDPDDPILLNDLAAIQSRLKPQTRAVELLEEAVRLDPSHEQIVENLWAVSHVHVRGAGFDRLAIFLGGPTVLMGILAVAVLQGWIHLPQLASTAVVAVAVPLMIAYAIADFLRNRARIRSLRSGTRALYVRRFYRDHWMTVLFFFLTMFVPLVAVGALAVYIGIPTPLASGVLVLIASSWILLGPVVWRTRLKPWLTRRR